MTSSWTTSSGVMTPAQAVADAWDKAIAVANAKSATSDSLFSQAMGTAGTAAQMDPATLAFNLNVVEPNVTIPQNAEGASVVMFQQAIDKLSENFAHFIQTYFPNECNYLGKAQEWICNALANGGTGMRPAIEDQIWQRDRARVLKDAARAEDEALASFAARRYPLPPGAAVAAVQRIRADAQDKIAQASRDVAIKQAEIEIENTRFAVQQAIGLYTAAINAAGDFIKSLAGTTQLIPSVTDSQSRLIGAAADYYRARIQVEELRFKATMPNAEWKQQASAKNLDAQMQALRNRVDGAMEAAKSLGTQAAAALNALHASAGISASAGMSVGYSYGGEVSGEVPPVVST